MFSAGSAFLTIVPSFAGIEEAIREQLKKAARDADDAMASAMPAAMRTAVRRAAKEGEAAGKEYGGAFDRGLRARLKAARAALGTGHSAEIDKLRDDLAELHDQHIKLEIDDATALAAVELLHERINALRKDAADDISLHTDLTSAQRELGVIRDMARERQRLDDTEDASIRRNRQQRHEAMKADLRDEAQASLSRAQQVLAPRKRPAFQELRGDIKDLQDLHINLEIDDRDALAKVAELRARLKALGDDTVNKRLKIDVSGADEELKAVESALRRSIATVEDDADTGGGRAGRRFATRFSEQIREAERNIPDISVDADTRPAERALVDIKARLAELSSKTVGIDIDEGAALAQLRALMEELNRVSRADPRISIRTDAAAAFAELAALDAEARRLDGRRINLNVTTDGEGGLRGLADAGDVVVSRMGAIISVALALGPAIVPAAAAATVAIGGIGTAAATAGIAIGVLGLAFHGIGAAVQAQAAAANDAEKSNKSLSSSANAVANAEAGVRTAERAVANARENAAYSAKQSARAIVDAQRDVVRAQRGVTDAVREAKRAQQDLTEALKEAKRQDEDRALSLQDNALAQRQATLDIADAKKALDKVLNDPKSTAAEREQAKITYQERLLQMQKLQTEQVRLQDEQNKSNREGVAGNKQVQAAQERVRSTTQGVTDAQQHLADAQQKVSDAVDAQRRQQRQSAQQMIAAQESLASAQRSLQQATVSAGTAGGAAMQKLQQAMAGLSPAGQEFARFVFGLKKDFQDLQNSAQENFLPKFQRALQSLLPYLPTLRDFIGEVADALGNVALMATRGLSNPTWQRFFGFLRKEAVPTIYGMAEATGNLITGLADLFMALTPFNHQMGRGLIDLTKSFQEWAAGLKDSQGYKSFLDYVARVGPKVVDMLAELGQLLVHLVVALAPVGEKVVVVVSAIAKALDAIPTGVLTALFGGLAILSGVILTVSGVIRAGTFLWALWTGAVTVWTRATDLATAAAARFNLIQARAAGPTRIGPIGSEVIGSTNALATSTERAGAAAGRTQGRFSALAGFMGGPLIGAIGIATYMWMDYNAGQAEIASRADLTIRALKDIAQAFKRGGEEAVQDLGQQDEAVKKLSDSLAQYGVDSDTVYRASNGDIESQQQVLQALQQRYADMNKTFGEFKDNQSWWDFISGKQNPVDSKDLAALKQLIDSLPETFRTAGAAATGFYDPINIKAREAAKAQQQVNDALADGAKKADLLRSAYKSLYDQDLSLAQAQEAERQSVEDLKQAVNEHGASLDVNSAAGRENLKLVRDRIISLNDLALEEYNTTGSVSADTQQRIDDMKRELVSMHFNEDEINKLIKTYQSVPPQVLTQIAVQGGIDANGQVNDLGQNIIRLINLYNITPAEAAFLAKGQVPTNWRGPSPTEQARGITNPTRNAEGGAISGPGTSTSDSIPALLSDGEHVWTAAEVAAAGGHGAVEDLRQAVLKGLTMHPHPERHAMGGAVGGTVGKNTNVEQTASWPMFLTYNTGLFNQKKKEVLAWAEEAQSTGQSVAGILGDPTVQFPPWPSSPAASRGDSGVWRNIVALIKSTGPISGEFGNSYRPGDPLWHGSGHAVDWMGFQQDALAEFLASRRPLELIHRSDKRDYAYTRGVDKGSFHESLMEAHKNHVHIAMDSGGMLPEGWSSIYNGTGKPEPVLTNEQWHTLEQATSKAQGGAERHVTYNFRESALDQSRLRAYDQREAALARIGRPR